VPAALLIISLLGLLLYLMTRCCDRKPRPAHSITSLKVALSIVTVLCCAAIGLGKFELILNPFFMCLLKSLKFITKKKTLPCMKKRTARGCVFLCVVSTERESENNFKEKEI